MKAHKYLKHPIVISVVCAPGNRDGNRTVFHINFALCQDTHVLFLIKSNYND